MSTLSLADHLALVATDLALVGHPIVAGLVAVVGKLESELVSLREENAEQWRSLGRPSGNSGQPPSQNGPSAPPRPRSRHRSRGRTRWQVAVEQVDVRVEHRPVPPTLAVTEHQAHAVGGLGCETRTRAAFPADAAAATT